MTSQMKDYQSELVAKIKNFQFEFLDKIHAYPGVDKWLSASAMQKAIRRGQPELAMSAATSLLYNDESKLWNRLKVISMEDVSPTQHALIRDLQLVANKIEWRRSKIGSRDSLRYFVVKLCLAPKSRVANDLLYTVNNHPKYTQDALEMYNFSEKELCDEYLNTKNSSHQRAMAAWYLCGVQSRSYKNMQARKGNWRLFLSLHQKSYYPDTLLECMRRGFGSGEGHSRTLGISWEKINKANKLASRNENSTTPIVGKWKAEAFDIHTRSGQLSFKNLLKGRNALSHFLQTYLPNENHVYALGMSVFAREGMFLNSREIFKGVDAMLQEATEAYVSKFGLQNDLKDHFFELVDQNIDLIHIERVKIAKQMIWVSASDPID